jgi:DNA-binding CsgD family transcriptional regulator
MFFKQLGNSEYSSSYSVNIGSSFDEFGRPVVFDFAKCPIDYSIERDGVEIPVKIFSTKISGLRAIVKYLVDIKSLSFAQVARLLKRDPRTIWTSYNAVKNKQFTSDALKCPKDVTINSKVFSDSSLSILESLSYALREKSLSLTEISVFLNKSPKTIWTVLSRAKNKLDLGKTKIKKAGGVKK